jgi:F0F1-type ATP synthase epsilon subunit
MKFFERKECMKKMLIAVCLMVATVFMAGCYGERVTVPTGHVGKVVSPSGTEDGIKPPSSFRLPYVWAWQGQYSVIIVETTDKHIEEVIRIFMPQDNLNMEFDVRMTVSIPTDDPNRINAIFSRLNPRKTNDRSVLYISFNDVYTTYAQPIIREKAREIAASYSIEQMLSNRQAISREIHETLSESLKHTPITILSAGLADIQPPPVIVQAQELAKQREIAIQQAEAEKLVQLTEASARLEVALQQQKIDLVEAETQSKVNEVLARSVNPAFIQQRSLRILEQMAKSPNKVFVIPNEAFSDPAMMMGINLQALSDNSTDPNNVGSQH